jgi:hypothetical protein
MTNQKQIPTKADDTQSSSWRHYAIWLALSGSVIINGLVAYRRHQRGEDWLSAFGLTPDPELLRLVGDVGVPIVMITLIMQQVRRLPPSREKTATSWLGWSLFVFLFVWWFPLREMLFGP